MTSMPAIIQRAAHNDLNPSIGRVSRFTGNGSDAPKLASFRFLGSRRGMAESKYLHKSQKVAVWLYHVVGTAK